MTKTLCGHDGGRAIGAGHTCRCVRLAGHPDSELHGCECGALWGPQAARAAEAVGNGPRSDEWEPDVSEALEAIGAAVGAAVGPLARAFQDVRQATRALTANLVALQESHAALLDFIDRNGVQANWALDRDMLETARTLRDRLKP